VNVSAAFVMCLQCRLLFSLRFIFISLSLFYILSLTVSDTVWVSHFLSCSRFCVSLSVSFCQCFSFFFSLFPILFDLFVCQLGHHLPQVCQPARCYAKQTFISLFLCLSLWIDTSFVFPIPPTHTHKPSESTFIFKYILKQYFIKIMSLFTHIIPNLQVLGFFSTQK